MCRTCRVEVRVLVVRHGKQPILHPECVAEVVAELVAGNLDRPAVEVLAVEQLDPVPAIRVDLRRTSEEGMDGTQAKMSEGERSMSGSSR